MIGRLSFREFMKHAAGHPAPETVSRRHVLAAAAAGAAGLTWGCGRRDAVARGRGVAARARAHGAQDRRALRVFDLERESSRPRDLPLGQPVMALQRWRRNGRTGVALLQQDGSVGWVGVA